MKRGKVLAVVFGMFLGSELTWGLPPDKERVGVSREVVRILLSEVQVAEMKLAQVKLEVVRFSGNGKQGPAVLLRGEGIVTVAGREDRVLLLADTASGFSGQWRKLSRGEVMQVPVKLTVQGETLSGALVVWQREGRQEGRFVSDEGSEGAQAQLVVQGLAAPQPNLPTSEYIVDFYANNDYTEWVGSLIRLCNGALSREGIQDGWTRTEEIRNCQGSTNETSGQTRDMLTQGKDEGCIDEGWW
ncbi:MAG: hypothetical protein KatS3mg007_2337 [Thermoanaerobaculum sp.]|nr:MAG: hypothetical protein KatS3mg007_2337 [Thermoanaerobaculum sp.]